MIDRRNASETALKCGRSNGIGFSCVLLTLIGLCDWRDAIVLTPVVLFVVGFTRRVCAIATILLFMVSFPPFSWPTWWFCLAPMISLWRDPTLKISRLRITTEAVAIGFGMGWLSTGFVRAGLPAWGWLVHAAACLVFSLQFLAVAVPIWLMRNRPIVAAAAATAVVAVGGELLEAWLGVSWSASNFSLTVGATPLAQWSRLVTPFGVAGLLYLVNFLLWPDHSTNSGRRWLGPAIGVGILCLAWCGGELIAAATPIPPLAFSAMLVQPHLKVTDQEPWRPWLQLNQLTRASLLDRPAVDLIVWPEACLSESWSHISESDRTDFETLLTVQDFTKLLAPTYKSNCLVGAVINERGTTQRYGLEVAEVRRYNCGCLVSRSGDVDRHEKLDLVPLKEGLPPLFDTALVHNRLLPSLKLSQRLNYGRNYSTLSFSDQHGNTRTIALSICYESCLPWLPQYRDESTNVDAIIHIVYDGNSAEHPSLIQRHIRACQFRAIETRKWNLVCSTWAGTSLIDPTGRIVRQLPPVAGVLRTDTL